MANESAYLSEFEPGAVMRVEFNAVRGKIQAFIVQLDLWDGEHGLPAIRYDNSHGRAHKDTISRAGHQIAKEWLPANWTNNESLTYAINDIRANWRCYRRQFWER